MADYISATQAAQKWKVSKRRVIHLCQEGRLYGAELVGSTWLIPSGAVKPPDARKTRYYNMKEDFSLPNTNRQLYSIDLFSGPGGLATGLRWAGIKPIIAVEWSDWTVKTYASSHNADILELDAYLSNPNTLLPFLVKTERPIVIHGDINKVEGKLIKLLMKERYGLARIDLVTGGAPCESFSMAGDRKTEDDRNQLYQNVLRIARATNSKMFLFENVKGLFSKKRTRDDQSGSMYQYVCDEFEERLPSVASFKLASRNKNEVLLKAIDYGVAQNRERIFLVGINRSCPSIQFQYPEPTHGPGRPLPYLTVEDAIMDLPPVELGMECTTYTPTNMENDANPARTLFLRRMRGDLSMAPAHVHFREDTLTSHKAPGHTQRMLNRICNIQPGENMRTASERLIAEGKEDIVLSCFPKRIYAARNRRLLLDKPSFTVTSHCLDEMIHPIANRGLTPREAARLQSFPDWYTFIGPFVKFHSDPEQDQYEQIGDAIPPLLAFALGKELSRSLSMDHTSCVAD